MNDSSANFYASHLARVVESSDDAIVSKDLNGIITSWNRGAERIFGYTADEAVGQSIRMIVPADRQGEEDDVLARIRRGESVDHYETIRQRKDRSRRTISLTVSPIRNDQGQVVGASKIARDITEWAELRNRERTQAAITEKLYEIGTFLASNLDRDAVVQKVIDVATQVTGAELGTFLYSVTDLGSQDNVMLYVLSGAPNEAFDESSLHRSTQVFASTFHGESLVRLEDVSRDPRFGKPPYLGMPDGHFTARSYLAVPVTGASGELLGGLFFGHSKPGVFNEERERLALGVAGWARVALENARLYVEARDASRMKDEFLAVLSHELRTPLNAIVGYTRLLRSGLLTGDKATRGLEALDRNSTWLTQIVEDVLDVSRIVSGKLRLDIQPVEMTLVVHNAVATMQPAADAKGVRIHTVVDPRVGPVAGDRDRLQQVVWNLLSNAVKFTPRDGRIQLTVERVNSHIEIVVADTGIGIRREFLPRIFDRFSQADSATTRKLGGLGLGLAIVRHIVELHGGTVEAFSAGENQGATFRLHLPLMIVRPQTIESRRQHPTARRLEPLRARAGLGGVRVFAVDDEEDSLLLLKTVLEAAGASVEATSSPQQAVEGIARTQPDVVLLDLGMPEIDGFELIRRIRALPDEDVRHTPAAALTAFARADDRTKVLQSGFEMHLAKPIDPAELVASVVTLSRRSRRRGRDPQLPNVERDPA